MSPTLKKIILFVVIGGLMIAGYLTFFGGEKEDAKMIAEVGTTVMPGGVGGMNSPRTNPAPGGFVNMNSSAPEDLSRDFLPILLNVKGVRLDDAIFADQAFATLRDSSILLVPDGTEGRPNPFAPIGSENISATTSGFENDISPAPNKSPTTPFSLTPTTKSTTTTTTTTKTTTPVSAPKQPNN